MNLFLDRDELALLTGKRTRPAQIRRLRERKIPHEVNALGHVLVVRSYVEQRFGGAKTDSPAGYAAEPDFTVFGAG